MFTNIIRYLFSYIIPAILGVALEFYLEGITLDLQGFTWWVPVVCGFAGLAAVWSWDRLKGRQPPIREDDAILKERQAAWERLKVSILEDIGSHAEIVILIFAFAIPIIVIAFIVKLLF